MNSKTDLTNFWIGWKATCAIRDCKNKTKLIAKCKEKIAADESAAAFQAVVDDAENVVKLAGEVIQSTNAEFVNQLNFRSQGGKLASMYGDQVAAWKDDCGSAFEIVEAWLYNKQEINGRAFKSYLFEDIATRTGNMCGNLFGYLKQMMGTVVRDSMGKEVGIKDKEDDEGNALEVNVGSTDDRMDTLSRSAELNQEIKEVVEFFQNEYLVELGEDWDKDYWISLYSGLNMMPINNPNVSALCRRSKSALAEVYRKTMGNLLLALRARFSTRAIGGALEGGMQMALVARIKGMEFFPALTEVRKKLETKAGK